MREGDVKYKVWDCCNFLNENDLLEIRLNEHWDTVDTFIVLEAGQTHTGNPKPFNFDKKRFEKYSSKLIYETIDTVDELEPLMDSLDMVASAYLSRDRSFAGQNSPDWVRDHMQGDFHRHLLRKHGAKPEDVVLISPVDEICSKLGFEKALSVFDKKNTTFRLNNYPMNGLVRPMFGFQLGFYFLKLNLYSGVQCCSQITEFSTLEKVCPTVARSLDASTHPCIGGLGINGWHFSCMDDGSGKMIHQKYTSWAHSKDTGHGETNRYYDMNTPEKALARVKSDFEHRTEKVDININKHPKFLFDNQEKFKHLIA